MQKILASHAGKKSVETGEFILAKVDLAMANDVTAPIAIKALEKYGITKLWNKHCNRNRKSNSYLLFYIKINTNIWWYLYDYGEW